MSNTRIIADGVNFVEPSVAANNIIFATNGIDRAVIDSSGNVGIGNLSPTNRLDVAGNVSVTGNLVQNGIDVRSFAIAMSTALSI
jgi:hypothetical protein